MTMRMRLISCLVASAVLLSGCGPASPEMQVIEDVAEALGGMRAVQNAETVVIEGRGTNFRLGQNQDPDAPLPEYEISEFTREFDLANGRWRQEQLRTSNFFTGNPLFNQRQIIAVDGDVAFDVSENGTARRASSQVARDRQAELYHYPVGLIQAATAEGATLSNLLQENGQDVVDIITAEGDLFTLFVDSETHFPSKIVSTSYDSNLGDVAVETAFDAYAESGGLGGFQARLTLPRRIRWSVDRFQTAEIIASNTSINGELGDLVAPQEVRSAEAPMLSASVTVEEVTSGVWYLAGQSHHSVLVELAEYLVLIEAPQHDVRTLAVIDTARELRPDKPLRYVINTHHHFDHSGGIRAAVSEGVIVITHELNRPFIEDIVARQHTITPDALARNPQPLVIETVPGRDRYVLDDGGRSVEIYPILDDLHSESFLMVYLPGDRLLVEADAFVPGASAAPFAANLLKNIEARELRVDRVLALHGGITPFSELQEAAMPASGSR